MLRFLKKDSPVLRSRFRFFYITTILFAIFSSLTGPFWIVYFTKAGLNYLEISTLVIANNAITLAFEIPTGIVADVFGRKYSVMISFFLSAVASLGIFLGKTFLQFLFCFILSGIAATFMSGAYNAWFFDSLSLLIKDQTIEDYWGHLSSGQQIGNLTGFLLGSLIVSILSLRILWLLEGIGTFLIFIYVFIFGKEEKQLIGKVSSKNYKNFLKEGTTFLFKSKFLVFLVLGSLVWFLGSGILSLSWQPFFEAQGINPKYFGLILSGYMIVSIFVVRGAGTFTKKIGSDLRLLQLVGLICASLTVGLLFTKGFQWILFVFYGAIYALHDPVFQSYLNQYIPSKERATILSTYNMLISSVTVLGTFIFGVISDTLGLSISVLISAIICFVSAVLFYTTSKLEQITTVEKQD